MKNKLALSVILVLLVGLAGWYFVFKNSKKEVVVEKVASWQKYVDEKKGIEMEVPAGWVTEPLVIIGDTEILDKDKYGGMAFGSPNTAKKKELNSQEMYPVSYSFSPESPDQVFPSTTERLEDKIVNNILYQVAKQTDGDCYAYIHEHKGSYLYFDVCGEENVYILSHMMETLKITR